MARNAKQPATAVSLYKLHSLQLSLRWVQGYRYLDRCGECLVQLENNLEDGWIPGETSPTSGSMKNEQIGMVLGFNSEGMNVRQSEYLEPEVFLDQSLRIYDTLRQILDIERITTPALRMFYQKGFNETDVEVAERELMALDLCSFRPALVDVLAGELTSIGFTLVTTVPVDGLERRRRLQASVIKQARPESFDTRILQRSRQLGPKQRDAIIAMQQLRKRHPELSPVAIQFELEDAVDSDVLTRDFNMADFLYKSTTWADSVTRSLVTISKVEDHGG